MSKIIPNSKGTGRFSKIEEERAQLSHSTEKNEKNCFD